MRNFALILIFSLVYNVSFSQETTMTKEKESVKWEISFDEAIEKAKKENKPVLIFFTGSDWCPPCKQVDRTLFHADKFKDFSEANLVLYKADFPRSRYLVSAEAKKVNSKLQHKYRIYAFPTVVMINAEGDVLGKKKGAYMPKDYYVFFEAIIKKN
jgi:thioredoxin-related protein